MQTSATQLELSTVLQLLEVTQEMAKLGGWELDIQSGNLLWTAETYRILDTSPEEFNPSVDAVVDYFLPESKEKIKAALDAAIKQSIEYDLELEIYTTKGRKIDVRATCKVTTDRGAAVKLTGVFQDISESINLRKEIERNHQRLQIATDATELGIWEYDLAEESLIWDKRMYELYGISADQFTASNSFWEKALAPEDLEQAVFAFNETIKSKQPFRSEFRVVHPDGSLHWIAANGYPIEDASGRVVKVIGTDRNIDSIKEYEERIEFSHKFSNTGSWEYNLKTGVLYWSRMIAAMFGGPEGNLVTSFENFVSSIHPEDRDFVLEAINSSTEEGKEYNVKYRVLWQDGTVRWLAAQGNTIRNSQDEPERMLGIVQDITDQKQIEDEVLIQSHIISSMHQGASLIRISDLAIVYTNPAFDKMFGYEPGEIYGKPVSVIDNPDDISSENLSKNITNELEAKGFWKGEIHNIKKDGTTFWCYTNISTRDHPLHGKVQMSVHTDITERKLMDEKLRHQASHDPLTGLISRYEFEKRVTRLLSTLSKEQDEHAMCFLDLDQFKVINDTCGHAAGDELLRQIGGLLSQSVRKRDTLARLGGDEFGVLMEHCTLEQAHRSANNILEAIKDHQFFWDGKTFRIGVSIGLVAVTQASGNFIDLFKQADAACYLAKDLGRNRIHAYHPDDAELAVRHGEMQWVGRITQALDQDRFCLYAQPITSLDEDADNHRHYEILIRMLDEQGGIIPPNAFLPAAERYNLMEKLDTWVISHACEFLAKQSAFTDDIEFISINLSGQSFTNAKLIQHIFNTFKETGISPEKICFEITETVAVSNMDSAIKFIKSLKAIGCRFALDDFGSGISSFGYLKNLPVEYLKIDGMFVKDIVDDPIDHAMVKSINEVAQLMGMKTIAEFVENDAIKAMLKTLGVNYGQGYGLGRPEPLEALILSNS